MILIEPTIQTRFGRRLRLRTLSGFLETAAAAARLRGDVSVLLTGDRHIRRLNRQFRRKDKPTDVLSFPAPEIPGRATVAGDLAISVETADRQARELGHPLAREVQVLILHGLLHLAGYDHEQDSGQMARREASLRRRLGLSQGLIERSTAGSRVSRSGVRQP
jgi:probable rRNA maturation factor